MIGFQNDLSVNTLIVSVVIALVGWFLKAAIELLISALRNLIAKLTETIARVEILDAKLEAFGTVVHETQSVHHLFSANLEETKRLDARVSKLENVLNF